MADSPKGLPHGTGGRIPELPIIPWTMGWIDSHPMVDPLPRTGLQQEAQRA